MSSSHGICRFGQDDCCWGPVVVKEAGSCHSIVSFSFPCIQRASIYLGRHRVASVHVVQWQMDETAMVLCISPGLSYESVVIKRVLFKTTAGHLLGATHVLATLRPGMQFAIGLSKGTTLARLCASTPLAFVAAAHGAQKHYARIIVAELLVHEKQISPAGSIAARALHKTATDSPSPSWPVRLR